MTATSTRIRLLVPFLLLCASFLLVACSGDDDNDAEDDNVTVEVTQTNSAQAPTPSAGGAPTADPSTGPGGATTGGPPSGSTSGNPPAFPATDEPPLTTASANGAAVEMGVGTYCWTLMCADKIGVPTRGTLTVRPGDIVTVAIPPAAPPLREAAGGAFEALNPQLLDNGEQIWPHGGAPENQFESSIEAGAVVVTVGDLAPGSYVLAVSMYFERGDVVYGVLLEVR